MSGLFRGTWIVVACPDGAMILENAGCLRQPDLRLIDRMDAPETPRPDGWADLPEVTDRNRLAITALAAQLVGRLAREAARGRADRLVLAAPDPLLDAIRARLDADLEQRVVLALPRRLTQEPLGTIVSEVNAALQRAA